MDISTRTKHVVFSSLLIVPLVCTMNAYAAGSASNSVGVSASITNNCTINAGSIGFGSYDPVSGANLDATGTFSINCTKGSEYKVALDVGSHADGTTRRMTDGQSNFLPYEIYKDPNRSGDAVWGHTIGTDTLDGTAANKSTITLTMYGRVPGGTDVPAGNYADTVQATVNF